MVVYLVVESEHKPEYLLSESALSYGIASSTGGFELSPISRKGALERFEWRICVIKSSLGMHPSQGILGKLKG